MPHQSLEQRREYDRKYRLEHKVLIREYQRRYWEKHYKKKHIIILHYDTEKVLKSIPNPFGSFEKAKYVIYKDKNESVPLYSFVSTCRNTEDCIEIMKEVFISLHDFKEGRTPKCCCIYKIQNGIKQLIFRDIV